MIFESRFAIIIVAIIAGGAGCVSGPQNHEIGGSNEGAILDSASSLANWGTIRLNESGSANSWLAAYQPFTHNLTALTYHLAIHFESISTEGKAVHAFLKPFFWLESTNETISVQDHVSTKEGILIGPSGHLEIDSIVGEARYATFKSAQGVLLAVTSDAPWKLDYELTMGSGPTIRPIHIETGTGAMVRVGGSRLISIPSESIGKLELMQNITTNGWTHVEVVAIELQPEQVRDFHILFPNGQSIDETGFAYGYAIPNFPSSVRRSGDFDYGGSLFAGKGTIDAHLTYAETATSVDIGIVHIPISAFLVPGSAPSQYEGINSVR